MMQSIHITWDTTLQYCESQIRHEGAMVERYQLNLRVDPYYDHCEKWVTLLLEHKERLEALYWKRLLIVVGAN